MMNPQVPSTVQRYRLPVKISVVNYRYLGTVPQCREICSGSRYAESHPDTFPDLVKLPESFGINGLRAEHPDGVDGLIAQVLAPRGPVLADIRAEKCENVFPMIPAGAAYNEMGLSR